MEPNRTAAAPGAATAGRRATSGAGPAGAHGNRLRPSNGHPVAHAMGGDGLRFRRNVLAENARVDRSGRLAGATSCAARRAGCRRQDRLATSGNGRLQRASQKGGSDEVSPNPTDGGRPGTRHHILVDRRGVPLAVALSGANVPNAHLLEFLLDDVPPLRRPRGHSRRRPDKLHADKACDSRKSRASCRVRRIVPRIARRGVESSERLGQHRWVVEGTFAWIHLCRPLTVRYERRTDIHRGFLTLAAAPVCGRALGLGGRV